MNSKHPTFAALSRRRLLALGGGTALLTASISGCGFFSTDPESKQAEMKTNTDAGAKESPVLAEKVKSGDLPPLEERIPNNPLVVDVPAAGIFGGTWHSVTIGPGDGAAFTRIAGYEPLLRKDPMSVETVPGICTDIEVSSDGKEFTLLLREGMHWSDGEPFTAEDVLFAFNEIWGNTELNPSPPGWLSYDGTLATAEQVDDFTVKIIFPEPNGTFRETAAQSMDLTRFPKHYVSKFLPAYNDNLEKEAKENDFDVWNDYYTAKTTEWENVIPTLYPWVTKTPLGEGKRVVLERNPYYWKTDPEGRQLPYIDTLSFEVVMDPEVMVLKGTDGELDMIYRHATGPDNKPVFAQSREKGEYELVDDTSTSMNSMIIALNLANKNKAHRNLFQNKDFRIGLSHAIDREELITAVWQRQGEPWQCAPTSESIFYDEEFAKQYTAFDVDLANDHLDRAGITDKDGKGFRQLPGGEQLTITLDIATALNDEWPAAANIIKEMWKDVGIRLNLNTIDRTLFYDRKIWDANEHDAGVWGGDGGLTVEMIDPRWYMPLSDESIFATTWARWYASRGTDGAEPIGPARQQIELYWELQRTPDQAGREELFRQILTIAKEQFWAIGIASTSAPYRVVKNRLKNVISGVPSTWTYATPGHTNPEMWFINESS